MNDAVQAPLRRNVGLSLLSLVAGNSRKVFSIPWAQNAQTRPLTSISTVRAEAEELAARRAARETILKNFIVVLRIRS